MNVFQYLHSYVTTNYTHSFPPIVNIYQFYLLIVSWTLIERIAFDFHMVFFLVFVRLNRSQKDEWIDMLCASSLESQSHTHTHTHPYAQWNGTTAFATSENTNQMHSSGSTHLYTICNSNNEAKVEQKTKKNLHFFFSQFRSTSSTCDRTYFLLLLAASVGMTIEY